MVDKAATKARRFKSRASRVLCDGREILKGADMTERRREVFERDGYRCQHVSVRLVLNGDGGLLHGLRKEGQRCLKPLTWETAHMCHVIPRWKGRDDRLRNLITKCDYCHLLKEHNREPKFKWLGAA